MGRSTPQTSTADVAAFLEESREAVDRVLTTWAGRLEREEPESLGAAMAYSLRAPGKRFRPTLVLAAYRELGGTGPAEELACAVEVVHTYSLVHDDLPCMDDDDLRRGRPTTHKVFGVSTATDAGFHLVPVSARVLTAGAERLGVAPDLRRRIARELYRAAGASGMVGGQVLDLEAEGKEIALDELVQIHRAKTGALIAASGVIGALAAGADEARVEAVRQYGLRIGLAFQIVDDVLDATATSAQLGKTAGKDAAQRKATYTAFMGVQGARQEAERQASAAIDHLLAEGLDSSLLAGLARFIIKRAS
ncbi:MAG: polyprenyl synthetase family protein [Planctomycetota bacterium]|jgi:geranylgeranyl pyrophosphate synthase